MIVVKTQAEYEAAYEDGEREFFMKDAEEKITFRGESRVFMSGGHAELHDNSTATLRNVSKVWLNDNSHAELYDDSTVLLRGNSSAELHGGGAALHDDSMVLLHGDSKAMAYSKRALIEKRFMDGSVERQYGGMSN
jgi:hypothetical protein